MFVCRYHYEKHKPVVSPELSDLIIYTRLHIIHYLARITHVHHRSFKLTSLKTWNVVAFDIPTIFFCEIGSISESCAIAFTIKRVCPCDV